MLTIDGTDGGGQLLRMAIALAAIEDRPVTIEGVRSGRERPGMRPQHLATLAVMADLTDARVEGNTVGATSVTFEPRSRPCGDVTIDIGTAGSIALVFEPLLAIGQAIDGPIAVTATGGTDVKWAPTMDYLDQVRLPALRAHGWPVDLVVHKRGYYPVGEGRATIRIHPASPQELELADCEPIQTASIYSRASDSLSNAEVAERQGAAATATLEAAGIDVNTSTVTYHDVASTGTSLTIVGEASGGYLGGADVGERGRPSEDVGEAAANDFLEAMAVGVVDSHLADQLLIPLALGGGRLRIPALTAHVEAGVTVLAAFGYDIESDTTVTDGVELVATG